MMAFVRFYLWTFKQVKKSKGFFKSSKNIREKNFGLFLCRCVKKRDL